MRLLYRPPMPGPQHGMRPHPICVDNQRVAVYWLTANRRREMRIVGCSPEKPAAALTPPLFLATRPRWKEGCTSLPRLMEMKGDSVADGGGVPGEYAGRVTTMLDCHSIVTCNISREGRWMTHTTSDTTTARIICVSHTLTHSLCGAQSAGILVPAKDPPLSRRLRAACTREFSP